MHYIKLFDEVIETSNFRLKENQNENTAAAC